jgi:hypothetical protein
MRLRTLGGLYAGDLQDYSYAAAKAALLAKTAEPVEALPASLAHLMPRLLVTKTTAKRKTSKTP